MDLARLVVKLTAQTAEYEKKLDTATKKLDRFRKTTDGQLKSITSSFKRFNNILGTIGVGVSLVAITRGLAGLAANAIKYGDEINKAAAKTGVGVEAFSELAYVAKINDIELSSLSTAFKKLQVTISEAGSGSKQAVGLFKALGIEFEAFRALRPDQQFELIADRISKLKDPADRTRAAVEAFGRAGADLLPMFEQGAEGIRKAREEAQRLGASLTEEQVARLAAADDAIKRLSASWDGFARTLTANVAPALSNVLDMLSNADQRTLDAVRSSQIKALLQSRGKQADRYADTAGLRRELAQLEERDRRRMLGGGRQATRTLAPVTAPPGFLPEPPKPPRAGKEPTRAELAGLSDIALTVQPILVSATEALYRGMDEATQTATERTLAQWMEFDAQVNELLAQGRLTSEEATARIVENNEAILEEIQITAEKILPEPEIQRLSAFAEQAAANVQDAFANFLFDPWEESLQGMLSSFVDTLRRMVAEVAASQILEEFFTGIGGAIGGTFGAGLSKFGQSFTGRASGGPVLPGHTYLVGEKGPELLAMGSNAGTIIPGGTFGGVNVTYNMDNRGATQDVIKALPGILAENNRRLFESLRDARSRGLA